MNLKLVKTKQCGLEVYKLYINDTLLSVFMSQAGAMSRFLQLKAKYLKGDGK